MTEETHNVQVMESTYGKGSLYIAPAGSSDEELQEYDHYYYGSLWSDNNDE